MLAASAPRPHAPAPAAAPATANAAVAEDIAALSQTSRAALELQDSRELYSQNLDLASLQRPFDFEFLRKCADQMPRLPTVTYDSLVAVPRAYEERYLQEPTGQQRSCRFGSDCEGLKLGKDGFVLQEFLLPGAHPESERRPCLLCHRKLISTTFYCCLACDSSPNSAAAACVMSPYYNLVNIPGEYKIEDCLCAPGLHGTHLPLPVIKHMRSALTVQRHNGTRKVEQTLYLRPDDADDRDDPAESAFFRRGASQHTSAR